MAFNPLDDMLGGSKNNNSNKNPTTKKKKEKIKIKANPIFKELRPLLIYCLFIIIIVIVSYFTIFNSSREYHIAHITSEFKETKNKEETIKSNIQRITTLENEYNNLKNLADEKRRELDEANLVRAPLEQGYYFIAYLDSLIQKYDIDLKDMYVKAARTNTGEQIDLTQVPDLSPVQYNLLPINVEFEGTYDNVSKLFSEFYTKRIVYDEDLEIVNKHDGTVNVKMTVKFDSGPEVVDNGIEQTQQITEEQNFEQQEEQ